MNMTDYEKEQIQKRIDELRKIKIKDLATKIMLHNLEERLKHETKP